MSLFSIKGSRQKWGQIVLRQDIFPYRCIYYTSMKKKISKVDSHDCPEETSLSVTPALSQILVEGKDVFKTWLSFK